MQLASSLQIAYSSGHLSLREYLLTSVISPECQRSVACSLDIAEKECQFIWFLCTIFPSEISKETTPLLLERVMLSNWQHAGRLLLHFLKTYWHHNATWRLDIWGRCKKQRQKIRNSVFHLTECLVSQACRWDIGWIVTEWLNISGRQGFPKKWMTDNGCFPMRVWYACDQPPLLYQTPASLSTPHMELCTPLVLTVNDAVVLAQTHPINKLFEYCWLDALSGKTTVSPLAMSQTIVEYTKLKGHIAFPGGANRFNSIQPTSSAFDSICFLFDACPFVCSADFLIILAIIPSSSLLIHLLRNFYLIQMRNSLPQEAADGVPIYWQSKGRTHFNAQPAASIKEDVDILRFQSDERIRPLLELAIEHLPHLIQNRDIVNLLGQAGRLDLLAWFYSLPGSSKKLPNKKTKDFCFALLPKLNKASAVRVLKQSVQKSYFSELFFAILQRFPGLVDSQKIQRLVSFIRPQSGGFAIQVLRMFPSLIGQKNRWYKFLTRAPALINND
jgi:hypothetical protein